MASRISPKNWLPSTLAQTAGWEGNGDNGKEGQTVIPFRFLWAGVFHNGLACVAERPREEEVIDRSGNIIPGENAANVPQVLLTVAIRPLALIENWRIRVNER